MSAVAAFALDPTCFLAGCLALVDGNNTYCEYHRHVRVETANDHIQIVHQGDTLADLTPSQALALGHALTVAAYRQQIRDQHVPAWQSRTADE